MPRHEQPRANGPRPKDHDRMHTAQPHISDGVAAQADYEDSKRIHDVGAYQLGNRIRDTDGSDIVPAGSSSGIGYTDVGAQYAVPTKEKELYAFKEKLIAEDSAADNGGAARWTRGDHDVQMRYDMWKRGQVYDKDRFAMSFVDMREPGNAQWMSTIYPEFMDRRMSEINRKHKILSDLERIKAFGVNSRDDFDLVYNIRSKRIGMMPGGDVTVDGYQPGWFASKGRGNASAAMDDTGFGNLLADDFITGSGVRPTNGTFSGQTF